MGVRRQTVEHPFGTFKSWMGSTHFLTRTLKRVRTEIFDNRNGSNRGRMILVPQTLRGLAWSARGLTVETPAVRP